MDDEMTLHHATTRRALWFGLLGGAVAWLVHLLLAYVIAEFGCLSPLATHTLLGVTAVAWMLLAATLVTLAGAVAATLVALRSDRRLRDHHEFAGAYMARLGLITSGLFVFIILVQSLPIFYYLSSC